MLDYIRELICEVAIMIGSDFFLKAGQGYLLYH